MSTKAKVVFISIAAVLAVAIIARMIWGCFHKDEEEEEENGSG